MDAAAEVAGAEEALRVEGTLVVLGVKVARKLLGPSHQDLALVSVGYGLVSIGGDQLRLGG